VDKAKTCDSWIIRDWIIEVERPFEPIKIKNSNTREETDKIDTQREQIQKKEVQRKIQT
jgi:hypothetical protein